MATVLYANVTNLFSRTALSKKLIAIVEATKNPDAAKAFVLLKPAEVEKLVKADPSLIQVAPSQDGGKTQPVQATAAGIAAVADAAPLVEKPKASHAPGSFSIDKGVQLPPINRGGDRAQMYPFDQLEVGDSFFVPVSESMPNPGKTLASTVSSATRRYKTATPPRVFTIRANVVGPDGATKGARIWRIAPEAATAEQASGANAAG
jgi:hypothetical protein